MSFFSANSGNINGRNIDLDMNALADIWDGAPTGDVSLIWVAPTEARIHNIVSSSTSDDGDPVGVGARTVRIWGLTSWTTKEVSEDVILNGTTDVPTVNAYVIINRIRVLIKGATGINVGTISATAITDATISAKIRPSIGETLSTIYGFPTIQKMLMGRLYANINASAAVAGAVDICLCVNPDPQTDLLNFSTRHPFGITTTGTSALTINYDPEREIEGPAIIKLNALGTANNLSVAGGYDFRLSHQ